MVLGRRTVCSVRDFNIQHYNKRARCSARKMVVHGKRQYQESKPVIRAGSTRRTEYYTRDCSTRYSVLCIENRSIAWMRSVKTFSIAYNIHSARQGEFGETLYPTIIEV